MPVCKKNRSNVIVVNSISVLALCNPTASNYLVVLLVKSLKVYDANMLSRHQPVCLYFHHWDEPPACAGELLASSGGSKIIVWRWLDMGRKICKSK